MYNHQLDTFLKVAKAGSFTKAAESAYISSAAVIQQINLLESVCGVKLFIRTHRGVRLTDEGHILYETAPEIIRLCNETMVKLRESADKKAKTIRIGTSLLFKCRLLPELCTEVSKRHPELHFEIPSISGQLTRNNDFSALGKEYDVFEGMYCTIAWRGLCSFLELTRTPVCCAVSNTHQLADRKTLSLHDLNGQTVVMPKAGVSKELDEFRTELLQVSDVDIIDSPYYGLDTFTLCEMMPYVLITQPVYKDIHTGLNTIPLETNYTIPYGLVYASKPSESVQLFIDTVREILLENKKRVRLF